MNVTYTEGRIARRGAARRVVIALFAALLAVLALAPQAQAQVQPVIQDPPTFARNIVVFPERDFAVVEGTYYANKDLSVKVFRDGVQIGSATGTADDTGFFEVNHPGGACWIGSTPDILPGDAVEVEILDGTGAPTGDGSRTATRNVTAEAAFINDAGNIEVHGTAKQADGSRIPLDELEQRIINPDLVDTDVGRRDIRATSDGAELGTISYNDGSNGTGTKWTAIYSGLSEEAKQIAVEGQTRVLSWEGFEAGERVGITIFEEDEIGGPGFGGCAAGATNGITDFGRDAINQDNVRQDLNVTGSTYNASGVSITLTDENGKSIDGTITQQPSPAADPLNPVHQTWKATFGADQVGTLADGMLTASTSYTIQLTDPVTSAPIEKPLKGADRQILKDTVDPNAAGLTATPGANTAENPSYTGPQSVKLQKPAGEDRLTKIHYTTNGNDPTLASRTFGENVLVTDDQTIRAIMVDRAGNQSAVRDFAYDIQIGPGSIVDPPANVTPVDFAEPQNSGINPIPQMPHEPVVFPKRDFVSAEGYEPFQNLFVRVIRDGHVIGTAQGTTDATGFFEVNHPGGVCWTGQTPDITAGDRVVVSDAQGNGDAVTTANVTAEAAFINDAGNIEVHGTAQDANGNPIDLALVEQRIINPDFKNTDVGRRDIRATSDGGELGTISYNTGTNWTATYDLSQFTPAQADQIRAAALAGQTRVLSWQATNGAGDRLGITIFEEDEIDGPGFGGCPQAAAFAATGASQTAVNAANQAQGLEIYGISDGAAPDTINVSLSNGQNTVSAQGAVVQDPNSLKPGALRPNAQLWKAAFSAGQIDGLGQGTLTASATYKLPTDLPDDPPKNMPINFEILQDTITPALASLTATPSGKPEYPNWQAITLEHSDDVGTEIRFTLNGNDPTPASRLASSQIVLDQRTEPYALKAIAVDSAGNVSGVKAFDYQIVDGIPPRQPGAPDLAAASDTGISNTDNLTSDAKAVFSGTAEAGSTVKVFSGATQVGEGTASPAGGNYSIPTTLTTDGPQDITVTATDAAGNPSAASAPLSIELDTSVPAPTANPAAGDYATTPLAVSLSVAETGARIFYTTNGSQPTASSTPFTANSAPISVSRSTLIRAISVDNAGNTTAASFNYRINAFAPTVTNMRPLNVNTRDRTPTIRATVLDRDRALSLGDITLRVRGVTINDSLITYNASTGALSYTPRRALALGPVPVSVRVTDSPRPDVLRSWSFRIVR